MGSKPQPIVDIPSEFVRQEGPPPEIKRALAHTEQTTPCGMPYTVIWTGGPKQGLPVTLFCAEPLCIRPGESEPGPCTGPRFVPHYQQFTSPDPQDPRRQRRFLDVPEILEAVKRAGEKATKITRVKDRRSDREIARHVGMVWTKLKESVVGGGWSM